MENNEIDIVKYASEIEYLCENKFHSAIPDACGKLIEILEKLRHEAVENIRLENEADKCLKSITAYK